MQPATVYRPEIDGLRAIAVVVVVLFHAGLGCQGGYIGVDVFFVISGFLITSIIAKQLAAGEFTIADFYARRVRRIAPALIVAVVGTVVASWFVLSPDDFYRLGSAVIAQPLMLANVYHWRNMDYFSPNLACFPLLHTWSLAVEEQFYLLFPVFFAALFRWRKSSIAPVMILMLGASFALNVGLTPNYPNAAFYLLPTRAWELLLGALLAWQPQASGTPRLVRELSGGIGLLLILAAVVLFDSDTPFPGFYAAVPCLGTVLFLWANQGMVTTSGRLLSWRPVVSIGKISYSLYLVHWPVIVLYRYWHWDNIGWHVDVLLVLVSVVLAALSYALVETPTRRKWVLRKPASLYLAATAAAVLLMAVGVTARLNNGFTSRFDPKLVAFLSARESIRTWHWVDRQDVIERALPTFGTQTGPLKVLLWGDSHAFAITPAIDAACKELGVKGLQATHSATAPLLGFVSHNDPAFKSESPAFSRAVVDAVRELKIETVVLASCWTGYPFNCEIESCIKDTVAALIDAGARVVIVRDVAEMEHAVPMSLARAVLRGEDPSRIGVPLAEHRRRNSEYDRAFDEVARCNATKVFVIDPAPVFVDESQRWRASVNGVAAYTDTNHLTTEGALTLRPLFLDVLR